MARLKPFYRFQNSPVKELILILSENPVKQMRLVLSKKRREQGNRFLSKIILSLKNDLSMSELLYDRDVITIVIPTVECIKAALKMKVVYLQ